MKSTVSIIALMLLLITYESAQGKHVFVGSYIDTSNYRISEAVGFLQSYYDCFLNKEPINYRHYFTKQQCESFTTPDPIIHAFTSDASTYNMFSKATIFFGKEYSNYVHLKTMFLWEDDSNVNLFAITNHYVYKNNKGLYFLTEMEHQKDEYVTIKNANIRYIFPRSVTFDKGKSDSLITRLRLFEAEWNFKPIENIQYVYADSKEELTRMKGLDYLLLMDENASSGYADTKSNTIYCQGKGENYLHEVLHLYLNPLYEKSPVNHGLIYYLGGGVGGNYKQMIVRLHEYLIKYPDINLSQYDTLISKDKMLHIDHTINAMLCKRTYEKEGVKGVKRLLSYTNLEELLLKEYKLPPGEWDSFFRKTLAIELKK